MKTIAARVCRLRPASERGSILIVSLIFCAVIGISLASYIALSTNSLRLANRSFYNTSAINVAETGVEEAIWCFNQVAAGTALATAWTGWTPTGASSQNRKRVFTDFTLSNGATASVRVLVINYNPSGSIQPKVYSEATITIPNESRTLTKVVEVDLRRRSRFAMGLVAKNKITFKGSKARVDSWNSEYNDDGTPRGSPVAYATAHRHASGSVGSTSVAVGSVAVNNADIFGFASVGGSSTTGLDIGPTGTVSGDFSVTNHVDYSRVATDFTANFDTVTTPGSATLLVPPITTLSTGTYTYNGQLSSSISVTGNVTLILTNPTIEVIRMTGGDAISIASGASLIIYAAGDIRAGGNGLVNPNTQASSLQIYGTNTAGQSISIGGTSGFNGVVYAPNADVDISGDADVMGSVVANTITVNGSAQFHYDEALANLGGGNPFGIVKWLELTNPTDRTTAFATW